MEDQPIRCEIELDVTGAVRLVRLPGCTLADARELCRLVADGDPGGR
jgi:hypothetical protein